MCNDDGFPTLMINFIIFPSNIPKKKSTNKIVKYYLSRHNSTNYEIYHQLKRQIFKSLPLLRVMLN